MVYERCPVPWGRSEWSGFPASIAVRLLVVMFLAGGAARASAQPAPWVVHLAGLQADVSAGAPEWPRLPPLDVPDPPVHAGVGKRSTEREPRPAQPSARSGTLLGDVGRDFGAAFTTPQSFGILGAGLAASAAAVLLDDEVAESGFSTELREGGFLDRFFEPAQLTGSAIVQIGGPVAMYGVGRMASKPRLTHLSRELLRAQILSQTLTQVIKRTARRARPDASSLTAFPSGHASGSFATAAVLQRRYGWKTGVPAYAFATWVAASRLNERRHWLSDLPFGAAIGVMAGRIVTRDAGRWTVAPMALPGGAGVHVLVGPAR